MITNEGVPTILTLLGVKSCYWGVKVCNQEISLGLFPTRFASLQSFPGRFSPAYRQGLASLIEDWLDPDHDAV